MHAALVAIELLAASVWTGGLVAIAVVARCARRQLDAATRVAFFRALGRRYLRVGLGALVAAYGTGGALLEAGHWSDIKSAIVVSAAVLVVVTLAGVVQARSLTRLRAAALAGDPRLDASYLARRAGRAGALRGLIATVTVTLVVLAALSVS
ncbi:MAG TPA: hypothetical protein VHP82_11615 [Gaiellaceae bacterium]|jgi:hypothetical protein|nr:hypothetical protein [Gaiellaceae bacterium]